MSKDVGKMYSFTMNENSTILFLGDSITHGWRDINNPDDLGKGFVMIIASWLSALFPEKNLRFLNRGIIGDRVVDLKERLKEDCLDIKPNVVSILIGINDCWRRFDKNDPISVEEFERNYRIILEQINSCLGAKVILCEPFLLPYTIDLERWREDLDPKIQVIRKLAREYGLTYIPLDSYFAQALIKKSSEFWTTDGIHPTNAGHTLIAQYWLKEICELNTFIV
jgi:lysophospholipase L1-like esterase